MTDTKTCRCGFTGTGNHPCHGRGYTCGKPGTRRLVSTGPAILAGENMKFSAYETWACEDCWKFFQTKVNSG